ncbi:hypothetical protein V7146_03345 [Gottfriedia acidiceleris]|uniref:hypothetical protein n=1 Tax=Gottfriedia acidiceleris TaxID=371036 RepID=UPI002FFFACAB
MVEDRIIARPFPQETTGKLTIKDLWTQHRNFIIKEVGIAIFIFGNKKDEKTNNIVDANGMLEEFEISLEKGVVPIPIGCTGFVAQKIWQQVMADFTKYVPDESLESNYQILGKSDATDKEILDNVIQIINKLEKRRGRK